MINEDFLMGTAILISDAIKLETNQAIIDLLVTINIKKLTSAAFLMEELETFEFCIRHTTCVECSGLYHKLLLGFNMEITLLAQQN